MEINIFMILIVLIGLLLQVTLQQPATQQPTWLASSQFCPGQYKAITPTTWITPNIYTTTQTLNCTSLLDTPRIILSLQGYKQNSALNSIVGFNNIVLNLTVTSFTSNYTIFGSNMLYLFYRYLVIYPTATQYYSSYQKLILGYGIMDTFFPLSSTHIFANPPGENFTTYYPNKIRSKIFLVGFKMNVTSTGTSIQLRSQAMSPTTHSITVITSGYSQLIQVNYFRLAFDFTSLTKGYKIFIDQLNLITGSYCNTVQTNVINFIPVNYLMGFNSMMNSANSSTDILLQLKNTPNPNPYPYKFSVNTFNSSQSSQYILLKANIFIHRVRKCSAQKPYYNPVDKLCYNLCPVKRFNFIPDNYCQQCHQTCYTCNGTLSTNCLSCDQNVFRTLNNTTSSCICSIGYYQITQRVYINPENHQCSQFPISAYQKDNKVCRPCIPTCQTCSLNSSNCLSCIASQHRRLSINNCTCANGYYQLFIYNPVVCLACNPTCQTCIQNQNFCLTCFSNQMRILFSSNNTCLCLNGFYETSLNSPECQACHPTCITCRTNNTFCLTCNATNYRVLIGNTCPCINGYYNNPSYICQACHPTCQTCNQTSTYCLSCNSLQFRAINITRNICSCLAGYYQTSINTCSLCSPICLTCNNSSQTCLTCNSSQQRILNTTAKTCDCRVGYFQYPSLNNNHVCARCLSTCQTCQNSSTYCMTCNASLNRVLNTTTHSCLCKNGYYQAISNSDFICLPCDPSRNQTPDYARRVCVCMAGYYNDTINNRDCQPCSIIPGCTFCLIESSTSNITCTSCNFDENYQLKRINNSNILNCTCIPGSYLNISGNNCPACNYKCLTCTNSNSCKSCSISIQKRIYDSAISNYCECIPGYFDDEMSTICKQCDVKCLTCSNLSTCLSCDSRVRYLLNGTCICKQGYYQSNNYGQCRGNGINNLYCGNGNIQPWQQCDDYNTKNGDGCSSVCKVEKFHVCNQYSNFNGTSLCYYNNSINMRLQSITKSLSDNKISLLISLEAIGCNLNKLKQYTQNLNSLQLRRTGRNLQQFSEIDHRILQMATNIYISSSIFTITDQNNYQCTLDLELDYNADIQTLQNRQISFISSDSEQNFLKYFFGTPISFFKLTDPTNRIPMKYIQKKYYQSAAVLSYIFLIIICVSLAFFLITSFIQGSVIPIQNILIIQLAYFCVLGQNQVELGLANLAFFGKFSSGVNIDILKPALIEMCVKLSMIYQQCNSIDNINLFFWLATISFFIVIGFLIYKYKKNKQLMVHDVQQNTQRNELGQSSLQGSPKKNIKQLSDSEQNNKKNEEYQLPNKSKKLVKVCLEFAVGVYFMTAIEFLLIALNLSGQYKSISIAYVLVVGLLFICLWSIYFTHYHILNLSYIDIIKQNNNKVSLPKLFYPTLFVFLMIWGAILSFVMPVISYSLLIVISCIWLVLSLRFELYKTKQHKIRATINQIFTILISILYIVLQYAVKDGIGLAYVIILQVILFGSLINNIGFYTYQLIIIKRNNEHKQDEKVKQYFKNMQQQFMDIALNKRMEQEQPIQNRKGNVNINQYESMTIKRQILLDAKDTKQALRGKLNQLKALRHQFKADKNSKDKKIIDQVQMINYFSKMN